MLNGCRRINAGVWQFHLASCWVLLFLRTQTPFGVAASTSAPGYSTARSSPELYDFDRMSGLVKRLEAVELTAPDTILGFYEPRLLSFSVKPGISKYNRVCVTSTCYVLLTI